MRNSRRGFFRKAGAVAGLYALSNWLDPLKLLAEDDVYQAIRNYPVEAAGDEDFWHNVKLAYTINPQLVNLNNGNVSPQPKVVQDLQKHYLDYSNQTPSYYMTRSLNQGKEILRRSLAEIGGVDPEEIALNRNTTEALDNIIFGLDLKSGDEVVVSNFDYPNMLNAWRQREMRDGIRVKEVKLPLPLEDEQKIIDLYTSQFSRKTKVVQLTHMINWTGQVIPVARIAAIAKERGIEVMVDGAHTFAHLDFRIPDLNCDYFGTSLHKWLCAPFGTGLLYVKKEKIGKLWPLTSAPDPKSTDIRKFEHLGTRDFGAEQAIGKAIEFHHYLGRKRKQERLHFLKNYWAKPASEMDRIHINTPLGAGHSCAIAHVSIENADLRKADRILIREYRIHTVVIEHEGIAGLRITPHVYTSLRELDRLLEALERIVVELPVKK